MTKVKNQIDFDLTFLDRAQNSASTIDLAKTKFKYNWKNIGFVSAIVIAVIILAVTGNEKPSGASSQPSSSSSSTFDPLTAAPSIDSQSSSENTDTGQFRCSQTDASAADQLKGTDTKESIDAAQQELEQRQNELDQLKNEIDTSSTNEYSTQSDIDSYNEKTSEYNSKLQSLKSDEDAFEARRTSFNSSIEAYNNYLQSHCGER